MLEYRVDGRKGQQQWKEGFRAAIVVLGIGTGGRASVYDEYYKTSGPLTYLTFDVGGFIFFPLRGKTEQKSYSFRSCEPSSFLIDFTDELV